MFDGAEVRTAAVVLAAGPGAASRGPATSSRCDLDDGSTLARRAASVALDADIGPVVVVTGAASVDRLALPAGCIVVVNHRLGGRPGHLARLRRRLGARQRASMPWWSGWPINPG